MKRLLFVAAIALSGSAYAQAPDESEQPRKLDSMSLRDREREMQAQQWQGPSGFWTSPHKATHGAYRYRLMLLGCALVLGMGLFTSRLVKKANAERTARG